MHNTKIFFIYSIAIGICLVAGIFMILRSPIIIQSNIPKYATSMITAGLLFLMLICGMCCMSWIHNMVYYIFFKRRNYTFQSVNLMPLLWINNNQKKCKITCYINSVMELHTQVSFRGMKKNEDCERYTMLYRKCIKKIFSVDIVIACLCIPILSVSVPVAIFLFMMVFTVIVLNGVESTDIMQGGIWKLGMKKGKEYCLFFKVSMEEFDKSIIYKYLQEINGFDFEEVNERMFISNVLMDSISDRKDYLTETVKKELEKEFLYCDNYKLGRCTADYLRMIKIFYCYLLNMGEKWDAIERQIDNNWRLIEAECCAYRFGRKLLEAISYKE